MTRTNFLLYKASKVNLNRNIALCAHWNNFHDKISAECMQKESQQKHLQQTSKLFETLKRSQKPCRLVRKKNYVAKYRTPNKSQQGGTADCCAGQNDIIWSTAYMLAYNCTKITKLREFQFQLLHRGLPTNYFLAVSNVTTVCNCQQCK